MWSMVSIILLLAGIAAMLWLHGSSKHEEEAQPPKADPLFGADATPSMKATRKYFFAVVGLILLQIGMGVITAHYAVEGQSFFGIPLAQVLPYVVSRTVHTQVGIFWIATAWLATGLYIAPLLSGHEPKFQKLGVDVLFWALIAIVVGSTATGWLGTLQHRGFDFSFWFGNQGLEFTSMGRVWQILLFVGLLFWVTPAGPRPVARAEEALGIARPDRHGVPVGHLHRRLLRHVADLGPAHALLDGRVLALVAGAPVGGRLLRSVRHRRDRADLHPPRAWCAPTSANRAIVAETIVFLFGGILGTLHHLYFTGTPTSVIAVGSVFSALEVVPLTLIGLEALQTYRRSKGAALAAGLQVAHHVLRRRRLLEHRRRRPARLRHQPAGRAVLRAGPEHDGRPRPRRAVRCLRHAGHRPDAVLPARPVCARTCTPTACSSPPSGA